MNRVNGKFTISAWQVLSRLVTEKIMSDLCHKLSLLYQGDCTAHLGFASVVRSVELSCPSRTLEQKSNPNQKSIIESLGGICSELIERKKVDFVWSLATISTTSWILCQFYPIFIDLLGKSHFEQPQYPILWEPTGSDFTWICICPACWVTSFCKSMNFSETPFILALLEYNVPCLFVDILTVCSVCPFVDMCVCWKLESCGRFRRFGIYSMSVRFSWLDSKPLHSETQFGPTLLQHFYLNSPVYGIAPWPCHCPATD